VLIEAYVAAGFHKIHLDCSMSCADDPVPLPDAIVAARSAELAEIAERTAAEHGLPPPVYVIGTEVPIPGGEASLAEGLQVTTPAAAAQTLAIHQQAFDTPQLRDAWQRVIAMVVQPGVDFDHSSVHEYDAAAAARWPTSSSGSRASCSKRTPPTTSAKAACTRWCATTSPSSRSARRPPSPTRALFALAAIEAELLPAAQCSRLPQVLDE
jgi:D-tagatose-1,6-bisphosphate aldolase subunit GatZ/KbaZ